MLKRFLSLVLIGLLTHALSGISVAKPSHAKPQGERDTQLMEKVRSKIARLGVGERARATVWLKDGSKFKGYISQARETDAVIRDRKTDAPTTVIYQDIARVDDNRGHGMLKAVAIGVAVGVGVIVTIAIIAASTFD